MQNLNDTIYDFVIIGCGMAGASIAYELSCLAKNKKILVLEAEAHAAYHTTGRSAAFYMAAYGNQTVRNITLASRQFYDQPPNDFCETALLKPCGALYLAQAHQQEKLASLYQEVKAHIPNCELVDSAFIKNKIPNVSEKIVQGYWEPESMEIDVGSLLNGYIKLAKRQAVEFIHNFRVQSLTRQSSPEPLADYVQKPLAGYVQEPLADKLQKPLEDFWQVTSDEGSTIRTKTLINAAGAWADSIAELAGTDKVGLIPKKRTVCIAKTTGDIDVKQWPLSIDIDEQFYFKPEGNNLLVTPADETPSEAHDAQANEIDIATGIDRMQSVIDIKIKQVLRSWAGLRTFASDHSPVLGYDSKIDNFFWIAGQGGFGIQMAPALAKTAAILAFHNKDAAMIKNHFEYLNIDLESIAPSRFAD